MTDTESNLTVLGCEFVRVADEVEEDLLQSHGVKYDELWQFRGHVHSKRCATPLAQSISRPQLHTLVQEAAYAQRHHFQHNLSRFKL